MPVRYVAYDWQGRRVEGVLETDSEEVALDLLAQQDLVPSSLQRVRPRRHLGQRLVRLFPVSDQELLEFTRQLAAFLRSGIPLHRGLLTLAGQARSPAFRMAVRQVARDIEGGMQFSEACARHPHAFPAFYVRLLRIAEATGRMVPTLQELVGTLERRKAVRDRVRSALTYPALVMLVAVVAGFVLVTYSLPAVIDLLGEFGGELPLITRLLVGLAGLSQQYGQYILLPFLGLLLLGALLSRTPRGARVRDRLLLRLPLVRRVVETSNLFAFASTFRTLVEAGVPPVESLHLVAEGVGNQVFREAVGRVARDTAAGQSLGQAVRGQGVFPPLLVQGLVTADVTGTLGEALRVLSDYYEAETYKAVSAATEVIQPLVIFLVAGFVGFVAAAVLAGIYSSVGSIQ